MRALLAAIALLALSTCAPAFADAKPRCVPVTIIAAQLVEAGVPAEDIYVTKNVGFISDYHRAIGLSIPDESQPIGFILVELGDDVIAALVEPEACVRFATKVSIHDHEQAFAEASKGV